MASSWCRTYEVSETLHHGRGRSKYVFLQPRTYHDRAPPQSSPNDFWIRFHGFASPRAFEAKPLWGFASKLVPLVECLVRPQFRLVNRHRLGLRRRRLHLARQWTWAPTSREPPQSALEVYAGAANLESSSEGPLLEAKPHTVHLCKNQSAGNGPWPALAAG